MGQFGDKFHMWISLLFLSLILEEKKTQLDLENTEHFTSIDNLSLSTS